MNNKTNESALYQAIQNSTAIKRGSNEKLLPFLTRSYEQAAGLQKTIPTPDAAAIRGAVQARLDASRAKSIASRAVATARRAMTALIPPSGAGAIARRIAANATKQVPLADVHDAALIEAATHRSAPESGRAEAIAELARRGFAVAKNGVISRNLKQITK
ncbi:MAG: hypothetical protein ORN51_13255 [Akkermansiaceae bacterium]|nr:hypothetical protein [Akkermansiaceae bacterium]